MAICEARFCSHSGPITKKRNEADGHFVARPKGSPQITHSCVATLDKETRHCLQVAPYCEQSGGFLNILLVRYTTLHLQNISSETDEDHESIIC